MTVVSETDSAVSTPHRTRFLAAACAYLNLSAIEQVISSGSAYEKKAGYSRAVRVGKHVQVGFKA